MSTSKIVPWTAAGLCLLLAACSGGGSGGGSGTDAVIQSVVQDLDVDPDGTTTVVTLSRAVSTLDAANFEADGGQHALSAMVVDDQITVTWDERVTPSHQVRISGVASVDASYAAVATSDDSVPSFDIDDAQQIPGLGDDQISLSFSGPRVVESEAEDIGHWTLTVQGVVMDLTGSTLDLDPNTQTMTIVTGPGANLHADFALAANGLHSVADVALDTGAVDGTASGDSTAPALVSAEQNLGADEFGRVVDFTFDEAMDPVFATGLGNFVGAGSDIAVGIAQPSGDVLRVTFNHPIVPGVDSITLQDLVDCAGNALPDGPTAIAAGSTVANDWATDPALITVANAGRDFVAIELLQALDPDVADDWTRWELEIDSLPVDLSTANLEYDLLTKSLLITLVDDYLTGDDFHLAAAAGNPPLDVDGQDFTASFDGTVTGDATPPTITSAIQNRTYDASGATVYVSFSEDVDHATAEDTGNWSIPGVSIVSATVLHNGHTVRVVCDDTVVPTLTTLDVSGVLDCAGNALTAVVARALTSSDSVAPRGSSATATAIEGLDNDQLQVVFSDQMVASYVEDPSNWSFESPVGVARDLSNAEISYDALRHTATVVFDADCGIDLQTGDDYLVAWTDLLDIGGNGITADTLGGPVEAETTLPRIVSAWVESAAQNTLHVRFSEPCAQLDDIAGLSWYAIHDNLGVLKGLPTSAVVDSDEMGVALDYGFALVAGSDALDCSGILDTCGNPLFSVAGRTVEPEDALEVALDIGVSSVTAQSGESNDVVTVVFDRQPSPWNLLDPDHYLLERGGLPIDLSGASFGWDGALTVTITLDWYDATSFENGAAYDLTLQGVQSAQGVDMSGVSSDSANAWGDGLAPTLPAGQAKLDASDEANSILIVMDEAIDPSDAADTGSVLLNGAISPDTCELLGYRTVRATFSGGVVAGDTVDVQFHDLAGNLGIATRSVTAADVTGPLLVAATGYAVAGEGGDYVEVLFNKQVDLTSALANSNYTLAQGLTTLDVSNAALTWNSSTQTVTLHLPAGIELTHGASITVGVLNVLDHAGLAISASASVGGTVVGDSLAPDFTAAFVNLRADAAGTAVEVLFDEDVDSGAVQNPTHWTCSGGQSVLSAERLSGSHWRLELSAALGASEWLELVGLEDLAGNLAGTRSITPLQ